MQQEVIIAGFGGQGVLFAGLLLAYAAMDEGKDVTWIPSYGPEMRGGTANCTVVVSDEEIGSPFVKNPSAVLAMNLPSLDKYEKLVKPGGVLVVNASMVNREVERKDINVVSLPANEIADEAGSERGQHGHAGCAAGQFGYPATGSHRNCPGRTAACTASEAFAGQQRRPANGSKISGCKSEW